MGISWTWSHDFTEKEAASPSVFIMNSVQIHCACVFQYVSLAMWSVNWLCLVYLTGRRGKQHISVGALIQLFRDVLGVIFRPLRFHAASLAVHVSCALLCCLKTFSAYKIQYSNLFQSSFISNVPFSLHTITPMNVTFYLWHTYQALHIVFFSKQVSAYKCINNSYPVGLIWYLGKMNWKWCSKSHPLTQI